MSFGLSIAKAEKLAESPAELGVRGVVHQPVDGGVEVGKDDDEGMYLVGEVVVPVEDDDGGVGEPAGREHYVDDEQCLC